MADITTYDGLIDAVQEINEDDNAEFEAYIPTAIKIAQERLMRECDFPDLEYEEVGALTVNSNTVSKPDDLKYIHWFRVNTGSSNVLLKRKQQDYIIDYWPNPALTGVPKYYSYNTESTLVIAPTPDTAYNYGIKYTGAPLPLGTSQQTNYFTANCPDILYSATLVEMAKFMKAWSQVETWELYFKNGKEGWNAQAARERRDNGEVPLNPTDGPNTIQHTLQTRS